MFGDMCSEGNPMTDKPLLPLENCPLCGGEAVLENNVMDAVIRCCKCKICLARKYSAKKDTGIDDAIKTWNTRAQKPLDRGEAPPGLSVKWPEILKAHTYASENADVYQAHEEGQENMLERCKEAFNKAVQLPISQEEIANLIMDINFENYGFSHEEVALKTAKAIVQAIKRKGA